VSFFADSWQRFSGTGSVPRSVSGVGVQSQLLWL
jgi:hypothetical protein